MQRRRVGEGGTNGIEESEKEGKVIKVLMKSLFVEY